MQKDRHYQYHRHRRPLSPEPTMFLPGTPEKVEVMRERDNQGYAIFHPLDAGLVGEMQIGDTVLEELRSRAFMLGVERMVRYDS